MDVLAVHTNGGSHEIWRVDERCSRSRPCAARSSQRARWGRRWRNYRCRDWSDREVPLALLLVLEWVRSPAVSLMTRGRVSALTSPTVMFLLTDTIVRSQSVPTCLQAVSRIINFRRNTV